MMLSWMLTTLLFGLCVALVAASTQTITRGLGWSARWIWCGALSIASLWPVIWVLLSLVMPAFDDATALLPAIAIAPDGAALLAGSPPTAVELAGQVLVGLWTIASLFLAYRLVRSVTFVRRIRDTATPRLVDGEVVLVTDDVGPAAVGFRCHVVLVPRVVLELDEPLRRLVLRHEREHCAARDPWLLFGAAVVVVLFPWNVALWVIARRLHLALELDCDSRVLEAGADPHSYGRLLLMMAQRRGGIALVPTFATPPSHLERRIVAMRTRLVRPRPLQLAVAGAMLVLGVAGACSESAPDAPDAPRAAPAPTAAEGLPQRSPTATPAMFPARLPSRTSRPVAPERRQERRSRSEDVDVGAKQIPGTGVLRYPAAMRMANRDGEVFAMFVVDERGLVDMATFRVVSSTDPEFTAAVREALPTIRFRPARKQGRAVRQVVEQPFTFTLGRN